MMTSAYEGWGITLTESQQFGVVPVVFNSYASLPDVVTDGESGVIVRDRDNAAFAEALTALMMDETRRCAMARAAVKDARRYESAKVCARWISLFESLLQQR